MKNSKGFTLVELAIVIVIIGLLVGGVLQGQELIKQAQNRKVIQELESFTASILLFKDKFGKYPGDLNNAEAIWGSDASCPATPSNTVVKAATCNGNGDNMIGARSGNEAYENWRFWQHLANAKLIKGTFTGTRGALSLFDIEIDVNGPRGAFPNTGIQLIGSYSIPAGYYQRYYNSSLFYGIKRTGDNVAAGPFFEAASAYQIDIKTDDGKPATGRFSTFAYSSCVVSVTLTDLDTDYLLNSSSNRCNIIFDLGF